MAKNISVADVDQAEAELAEAKKNKKLSDAERDEVAQRVVELRSAFRTQEVDAGRRAAGVGITTGEDK